MPPPPAGSSSPTARSPRGCWPARYTAATAAGELALAPDELAHLTAAADRFHRELVRSAGAAAGRRLRPTAR